MIQSSQSTAHGDEGALPRIAVVVVTYNSADLLGGCLESLHSDGVALSTIVVADNASDDDSVAIAEKALDHALPVRIVEMGRNAGYAAAVNAAVATLDMDRLDAVFISNPDCRLRPDSLRWLCQALQRPRCGIAVPRLVNSDGSLQPSLRRAPTIGRALAEAVLGRAAGRLGTLGELISAPAEYDRPCTAAWATGAAMLVSVEALRDLGPWDESFFLYSEETEYCLRAADQGWALWYEPAAVVAHIGGDSGTNPLLGALLVVNKVALYRRRHGAVRSASFYLATALGEGLRALAGRRVSQAALSALMRRPRRPAERFGVLAGWPEAGR